MRRVAQVGLLFAVVIPFAIMVRWADGQLPQRIQDVLTGVPLGIAICYGFWRWDARIKERHRRGEVSFWD